MIRLLESCNSKNNALYVEYRASATMLMAKHVFNPFSKLKYFKKGKEMLHEAIASDRENVELRFLRFAAQMNALSFLGYKDHIKEDKQFLLKNVPQVQDTALKKNLVLSLRSMGIKLASARGSSN